MSLVADGIALIASGLGTILVRQLLIAGSGGFFVRFSALAVVLVSVSLCIAREIEPPLTTTIHPRFQCSPLPHSGLVQQDESLDAAGVCPQPDPVKEHLNWIKRMLGADGNDSPEEENADVLRRMANDGDDLTKARHLDFHHLFAREEDALTFKESARNQGYWADHDFWNEANAWLTAVHVRMVPTLEEITAMELSLDEIARSLGGEPDGWGCMEVDGANAR